MLDAALNTSLRSLTNAEIEEIACGGVQEDGTIEFKSGLDESDVAEDKPRWADGGKLSKMAKADLLRAVIAFANAYGGTLYLGVKESADEPKRSAGFSVVPRIHELITVLCDAMRDTIDPRLPSFDSRAWTFGEGDAGVIAIRVPASPIAPHWNSRDRQCYRRIGSSSQQVGMREIQSITLDRARTKQDVDALFVARQSEFARVVAEFPYMRNIGERPKPQDSVFPSHGMAMRCTAIPLVPITVNNITSRLELRVGVQHVRVRPRFSLPGIPREMGLTAYSTIDEREFQPALRGWAYRFEPPNASVRSAMLVRGDGLIERTLCDVIADQKDHSGRRFGVRFDDAIAFVLSVVTSIEVFRTRTGTSEVPYELEFELIAHPEQNLLAPEDQWRVEAHKLKTRRTLFPRTLVGRPESFENISDALQVDIWNAAGEAARILYDFDVAQSLGWRGR
jgi:Putative DNA-binding domain